MADGGLSLEDILNEIDDDGVQLATGADVQAAARLAVEDIDDDALLSSALRGTKAGAGRAGKSGQQSGLSAILRGSSSARPAQGSAHSNGTSSVRARTTPRVAQPQAPSLPPRRQLSDDEILAELLAGDSDDDQLDADISAHLEGLVRSGGGPEPHGAPAQQLQQRDAAESQVSTPSAVVQHHTASVAQHASRRSSLASDGGHYVSGAGSRPGRGQQESVHTPQEEADVEELEGDALMAAAERIARKYTEEPPETPSGSNVASFQHSILAEAEAAVAVAVATRKPVQPEQSMQAAAAAIRSIEAALEPAASSRSTLGVSSSSPGKKAGVTPAGGTAGKSKRVVQEDDGELDLEAIIQSYSGVATAPAASKSSGTSSSSSSSKGKATPVPERPAPVSTQPPVPASLTHARKEEIATAGAIEDSSSPLLARADSSNSLKPPVVLDPRVALIVHSSTALQRAAAREYELLKAGNYRTISPLASRRRFKPRLPAHVLRAQARAKLQALTARGLQPFFAAGLRGAPGSRRGSFDSATGSVTTSSVLEGGMNGGHTGGGQGLEDDGLAAEWLHHAESTALTGVLACGRKLVSWYRPGAGLTPTLAPPPVTVSEDGQLQVSSQPMNVLPSVLGILRVDALPGTSDVLRRSVRALTQSKQAGDAESSSTAGKGAAVPVSLGLPTAIGVHGRFYAVGTSRSLVLLFDAGSGELKAAFNARGHIVPNPSTLNAAAAALGIQAGGAAAGAAGAAAVGATDGAVTAIDILPAPVSHSAPGQGSGGASGAGGSSGADMLVVGYQSGRVALWSIEAGSLGKSSQLRMAEGYHKAPIAALRFISTSLASPTVLSADIMGAVHVITFSRVLGLRWSVDNKCILDGSKTGPILAMDVLLPPVEERYASGSSSSGGAAGMMAAAFSTQASGAASTAASSGPPYGTLVALSTKDATFFLVTAPELSVVHKWPRPEGVPDGVVPALAWARGRVHGGAPLDAMDERRAAALAAQALAAKAPGTAISLVDQAAGGGGEEGEGGPTRPRQGSTAGGGASPPTSRRSSIDTEASNRMGVNGSPLPALRKVPSGRSGAGVGHGMGMGMGVGGEDKGEHIVGTVRRAAAAAAYRQGSTLPGHGVITTAPLPVLARAWGGHVQLCQVQPPGGFPLEQTNVGHLLLPEGVPGAVGPSRQGMPMQPGSASIPAGVPRPTSAPLPAVPVSGLVGGPGQAKGGSTGAGGGGEGSSALFGSLTSTLMNVGGLDGPSLAPMPGQPGPAGAPTRAVEFVLADDLQTESGSYVYSLAWLNEGTLVYTATGGPTGAADRLVLLDTVACEETDAVELTGVRLVAAPPLPSSAPVLPPAGQGVQQLDTLAALPPAVRTRLSSSHAAGLTVHDGCLYMLSSDKLLCSRMQRWNERAAAMVSQGEWLAALALALDTHDAATSAHAAAVAAGERQAKMSAHRAAALARIASQSGASVPVGGSMGGGEARGMMSPDQAAAAAAAAHYDPVKWEKLRTGPGPAAKGTPLGDELQRLLLSYLTEMAGASEAVMDSPDLRAVLAMLPPLRRGGRTAGRSALELHWALLASISVDYCCTVCRVDLLFHEVYDRFNMAQRAHLLLEACEPYIINERLSAMPPSVLKAFVDHYRAMGALAAVERCLLHLDLAALDVDGAVRTCSRFRLYSALIYVMNRGLLDFTLPVDLLLSAVFDEQAGSSSGGASRMLRAGSGGGVGVELPPSRKASLEYFQEGDIPAALLASPEPKDGGQEREVLPMSPAERVSLGYALLLYVSFCLTGRSFPHGKKAVTPLLPLLPEELARTVTAMHHAMTVASSYGPVDPRAAAAGGRGKSGGDAGNARGGRPGVGGKGVGGVGKGGGLSTWDLLFAPPEAILQAKARERHRSAQPTAAAGGRAAVPPPLPPTAARGGAGAAGGAGSPRKGPAAPAPASKSQEDVMVHTGPTPASVRADLLSFLFTSKPPRFPAPAASMLSSAGLLSGAGACSELPGPYPRLQAFLRFDALALLTVMGRLVSEASDALLQCVIMSEGAGGLRSRRWCLPGDAPLLKVPPIPMDAGGVGGGAAASMSPPMDLAPMLVGLYEAAHALAVTAGYTGGQAQGGGKGGEDGAQAEGPALQPKGRAGGQKSVQRKPYAWQEARTSLTLAFTAYTCCKLGPGVPALVNPADLSPGLLEDMLAWLTAPPPAWTATQQVDLLAQAAARASTPASRVTGPPVKGMVGLADAGQVGGTPGEAQGGQGTGGMVPQDGLLSDACLHACISAWDCARDDDLYGRASPPCPIDEELQPYAGVLDESVAASAAEGMAAKGTAGAHGTWTRETLLVRFLRTVPLTPPQIRYALERCRASDLHRGTAVLCALQGDAAGVVDAYLRCPQPSSSTAAASTLPCPSRVFKFIRGYVAVACVGLGRAVGEGSSGEASMTNSNPLELLQEETGSGTSTLTEGMTGEEREAAAAAAILGPSVEVEGIHERALAVMAKRGASQGGAGLEGRQDTRGITLAPLPPTASSNALRTLRSHVMRVLPKLVSASESTTASLILDTFPEKSEEVIQSLERYPHMQYAYLGQFLRKAGVLGGGNAPSQPALPKPKAGGEGGMASLATLAASGPSLSISADIHLRYIDLLCQYEPTAVLPYLVSTSTAGYSLEGTLSIVRDKHSLPGPTAYLLERTGDVRGAQSLGLQTLEEAVGALAVALRNASLGEAKEIMRSGRPGSLHAHLHAMDTTPPPPAQQAASSKKGKGAAAAVSPADIPAPMPTRLHMLCAEQVQAVWSALQGCIALCARCSAGARFNDSEAEKLWLALLDRLVASQMEGKTEHAAAQAASHEHELAAQEGRNIEDSHAKNIAASVMARYSSGGQGGAGGKKKGDGKNGAAPGGPDAPTASTAILLSTRAGAAAAMSSCAALLSTLSFCLRAVLDGMKGVVALNTVMAKVLSQHSRAELSEFEDTLHSMLSGYSFDVKVLGTANNLMADDLYKAVKRLHGGYAAGVAPRKARGGLCSACQLRLYAGRGATSSSSSSSSSGQYVLVYGCGHSFHESCVAHGGTQGHDQQDGQEEGEEGASQGEAGAMHGCPLCSQGQEGRTGKGPAGEPGSEAEAGGMSGTSRGLLGRAGAFGRTGRQAGGRTGGRPRGGSEGSSGLQEERKAEPTAFTVEVDDGSDVHKSRLARARATRARQVAASTLGAVLQAAKRDKGQGNTSYGGVQGRAGMAPSSVLHSVLHTDIPSSSRASWHKVCRRDPQEVAAHRESNEPLFKAGCEVSPFDFDMDMY